MKKMLFLIPVLILLASCNKEVCPAYSDAANNVKSSVFQSKAYALTELTGFTGMPIPTGRNNWN